MVVLLMLAAGPASGAGTTQGGAPVGGAPGIQSASPLFVEVTGDVPGFSDPHALASFLAAKMTASMPAWHCAAAPAGQAPPNRIEWKFKTLRVVWGGGSHNGFPQPFTRRSYLSAEVRVYLDDQYQMTMLSQSTVVRGAPEADLATMAAKVTQSIAGEAESDRRGKL